MPKLIIGVLALQGDFAKHIQMLQSIELESYAIETTEVRKPIQLENCDALLIPGGESTSMLKQMHFIDFSDALKSFAQQKPIFGTCAGLILISNAIASDAMQPFGFLDVQVERNAYGRQNESFTTEVALQLETEKDEASPCTTQPFKAVFIRAPRIQSCGPEVNVLARLGDDPILVQQGKHLGATFHPELTSNTAIHRHFLSIVEANLNRRKSH